MVSVRRYKCGQIYVNDFCSSRFFTMKAKSDVHHMVDELFHRYGVPTALISNNAKELILGDLARKCKIVRCNIETTDPYCPWQNRAQVEIRENKRMTRRWTVSTRSLRRLWFYCAELASLTRSHTAMSIYQLQGQVQETPMTGETAAISHLYECRWYKLVFFHDGAQASYPDEEEVLRRYLGPIKPGHCSVMSY